MTSVHSEPDWRHTAGPRDVFLSFLFPLPLLPHPSPPPPTPPLPLHHKSERCLIGHSLMCWTKYSGEGKTSSGDDASSVNINGGKLSEGNFAVVAFRK